MAMTDSRGEDEILDLAVSALPSLSRRCRAEAVWLDGAWRSVGSLQESDGVRAGLEGQVIGLGIAGGALQSPGIGWTRAFPLSSRGGASGYLVVGSNESPPEHERTLIQALALQTGMALAQARLLSRERATWARIVDEQATLRRLVALVARTATPEEVFAAVAAEAGRLLDADFAVMSRFDSDGSATVLGEWVKAGGVGPLPPGTLLEAGGHSTHGFVFQTGRPVRMDDYGDDGVGAAIVRAWDVRSVVGVPIHLDGRLWGLIGVASLCHDQLPADTETWLASFTDLLATALASTQARMELAGVAEEQSALRRVATLVARAAPPEDVFRAVAAQIGRVLEVDFSALGRYDADGAATIVGAWATTGPGPVPAGVRMEHVGRNIHSLVYQTGRPARIDDCRDADGPGADLARVWGFRSAVGAPIHVEGRLWGVVTVASMNDAPLPVDTEGRLAGFAELVATAVANAEARAALTASRARIVAAADTARRRIERDLHDGAQQHLVSLALKLRAARASIPPDAGELAAELDGVAAGIGSVLDELRELAQGIHPPTLAAGGLGPALGTLARRSGVPVALDVGVVGRLPEPVEVAVYYVVAEALTNAAKHAQATLVNVGVHIDAGRVWLAVRDDGIGGAEPGRGSGLVGLRDRVEAIGGTIDIASPKGSGTTYLVTIPV